MKSTPPQPLSPRPEYSSSHGDQPAPTGYSQQQVLHWNEERVCKWLREQGFGQYEDSFIENQINGEALLELDYSLLKELSIWTIGERVRLNVAIKELRNKCMHGFSAFPVASRHLRSAQNTQTASAGQGSSLDSLQRYSAMDPAMSVGSRDAASLGGSSGRRSDAPVAELQHPLQQQQQHLSRVKRQDTARSSSAAGEKKGGNGPARDPRIRMLFGGKLHADGPPSASSSNTETLDVEREEIERLHIQFKEFFGTDIGVSNLADSLSVKTRHVSVTGPDNQTRQVALTSTRSAQDILNCILREFELLTDIDKDRYALFVMSSDGGGARSLSEAEIIEVVADPEYAAREKLFLRKRHQLSRPPVGAKRSEHLQRAIEKLGNILPMPPIPSHRSQQASPASSAAASSSRPHFGFEMPAVVSGNIEKMTRVLGERPPSELVSMNVEKYFPGNEARARHSVMRRQRRESQESLALVGLSGGSNSGYRRSAYRRSVSSHRRSTSSTRAVKERLQKYTITAATAAADAVALSAAPDINTPHYKDRGPGDLHMKLEPIGEKADEGTRQAIEPTQAPGHHQQQDENVDDTNDAASNTDSASLRGSRLQAGLRNPGMDQKRLSRIYAPDAVDLAIAPGAAIEAAGGDVAESAAADSDDQLLDSNSDSFSDFSTSTFSSTFDSADSFYERLSEIESVGDDEDFEYVDNEKPDKSDMGIDNHSAAAAAATTVSAAGVIKQDAQTRSSHDGASERLQQGRDRPDSLVEDNAMGGRAKETAEATATAPTEENTTTQRAARSHAKKRTWIKGAPIASGSFGSVYFCMNTRSGVIMAVKEVELPTPGSEKVAGRKQRMADALRREISLLQGLDHRNVVKYLGTDVDEKNLYIFLEYVSGGSVSSALASFGMFPESLVRAYTAQILEGLEYLHSQGIIHRDIKGGNVLIDQNGSVKISDFGISKRADEVAAASATGKMMNQRHRASLQGSVFWMAPEVVKDTMYTFKGDIWSLGCLVIEMFTGKHPFPELDQMQALLAIGQMSQPKIPEGISDTTKDFLENTLELDFYKRPSAKSLRSHSFVAAVQSSSP